MAEPEHLVTVAFYVLCTFLLLRAAAPIASRQRVVLAAYHTAFQLVRRGHWRGALVLFRWAGRQYDLPTWKVAIEACVANTRMVGGSGLTAAQVRSMLDLLAPATDPEEVVAEVANTAVNSFVALGAYAEALAVGERWDAAVWERLRSATPDGVKLIDLNKVEALYNTGDWAGSLVRLDRLQLPLDASALLHSGWRQQRAWILAALGRVAEAKAELAGAVVADVGPLYASEHHYTHAAVRLAAGDLEGARAATRTGKRLALRAASRRNAEVLLARIAAATGDDIHAEALCARAARMVTPGQAGDNLLLWGTILARLGRDAEARAAWAAAIENDGESEAAAFARERLGGGGEVTTCRI
ncbi:MAG: hypothetical protein V4850_25420 [Myxococcota bacterium]